MPPLDQQQKQEVLALVRDEVAKVLNPGPTPDDMPHKGVLPDAGDRL